jgi:predicted secreted protein
MTLTDASKEVGLEVNIEKTKYMLVSRNQNAGQNWDMKIPTGHLKLCHSSNIWEYL